MPVGDLGVPADLNTYLSFGGEIDRSDLAIVRMEPEEGSILDSFWGGMTGLIAGAKAAMDETINPSTLLISCFETLKPGVGGQDVEISSGASLYEADSAGSVRINTGEHPTSEGAEIQLKGGSNGDPGSIWIRGEVNIEGNTHIGHGTISLDGDVTVNGTATMHDATVNGTATMHDATVNGTATMHDATVNTGLTVGGSTGLQDVNVNTGLTVGGSTSLQGVNVSQELTVGGSTGLQDVNVNTGLTVGGSTDLQGGSVMLSGLGAPAVGDALVAQTTTGEVKWASPSQYVSGTAMNVGDENTTNIKQVIFTDPTSGTANNAGCWIVPMDITIDSIFIKWVGDNTPVIASGRDLTWNLGTLTDEGGSPDIGNTTPYNNFDPYTSNPISALEVNISDTGTFFYKTATGLDYDINEGEILVLNHHLAVADWTLSGGGSAAHSDVTVTIKYRQRYS
jgi:hypothetical protein